MKRVLVDTNVAIVANESVSEAPTRPLECINACVEALIELTKDGHLFLDDGGLIFHEYASHLDFSGQPGVGDAFMKWVHDRQWDEEFCTQVPVTPHDDRGFVEFPDHPLLATFDPADRKFVAVAAVPSPRPTILQAVDHKWHVWEAGLSAVGIAVLFLCAP